MNGHQNVFVVCQLLSVSDAYAEIKSRPLSSSPLLDNAAKSHQGDSRCRSPEIQMREILGSEKRPVIEGETVALLFRTNDELLEIWVEDQARNAGGSAINQHDFLE